MYPPLTSARAIGPIADVVASAANSAVVSRVFEAADLPETVAETPNLFIPQKNLIRFIDGAAHALGDRDFGLFLAPHLTIAAYGDWGGYLLGAATLEQALFRSAKAIRFHATHNRLFSVPMGNRVAFIYDVPVRGVVGYRHYSVCGASVLISLVRAYTGADWNPLRVDLDIPRPPSSMPYEDLFRCPVVFDRPSIAIYIERDALNYSPVRAAGRRIVTYSDLGRLPQRPAPRNLISMVTEVVRLRLLDGGKDIDGTARHLELGPRTLQRRLNDEGTTFQALVSQVLAERAIEILRETEAPMIDIAVELGYSSSSHFARAFHKTVGLLPSDIRRGVVDAPTGV